MNLNSCRICLVKDKELTSLFSKQIEFVISELFLFCLQSFIHEEDQLPQFICSSCLAKLKVSNEIKIEFLKNDKYLRSFLFENSDDSNKQIKEPLVDLLPIFEQVILPENVNSEVKSDKSFIEESDIEPSVAKKGRSKKLSKKSPSKNFDCFICDKNFSSRLNKMNHIKDVHDQEVHVCTICNFISVSAKYLDQHMKNHKISKNFLCEHCSKKFFVLSHLREHVTLTHKATIESYAFACDQCPKRFKGSQNLKRHLQVHGSEKIFKCAECNAGYSRKETLEVHLFRQHGFDAKIKCNLCKNAFPNMSKLRKHQEKYKAECGEKFRTRTIDKNVEYSCNFCYRVYKDKTHYQSHIHMHNNNRPFKCQKCQKGFFSMTNLNSHKVVCENLLLFKCLTCEKAFNKQETLDIHVRGHTGEKPFGCENCSKKFASRKMFSKHQRNIHNICKRIKEFAVKNPK